MRKFSIAILSVVLLACSSLETGARPAALFCRTASQDTTGRHQKADSVFLKKILNALFPVPGNTAGLSPVPAATRSRTGLVLTAPGSDTNAVKNSLERPMGLLQGSAAQLASAKAAVKKTAPINTVVITDKIAKQLGDVKMPAVTAGLSLENDFRYHPVPGIYTQNKIENVVGVRGSVVAFGFPVNISISNNQAVFNGDNRSAANLYKLGLNPDMFSGLLKNQLQQYTDLKNTAFHGFDFTEYVRQTLSEQVRSINGQEGLKNADFHQYLGDAANLQGLIQASRGELKSKLAAIADRQTSRMAHGDTALAAALGEQNQRKADSIALVITAIKTLLQKKGIDPARLLQEENYLGGKSSPEFNSSEQLTALMDKKPANGLQSLLTGVKDFRFGSFGSQVPGATDNESRLVNGASLGIKVSGYPLTFGYGKLDDISSLKDAGYQHSVYSAPKNITYIGGEIRRSIFGKVKFSVVSSFSGQGAFSRNNPSIPSNAVAFTLTKFLNFGDLGNFAVNVSKSSTLYNNNYQVGSEAVLQQMAGVSNTLNNDLFQSMAVGFSHDLNSTRLNATEHIYFNYGGLGYQNPANNGNSGSTMKFGGSVRKAMYRNKLQFILRTDFRQMPLSYISNDKWKNYQLQFTGRYQVSNKLNFSLKYLSGGTGKVSDGVSVPVYNTQKFELDANDTYKIGKYYSTSHISIGNQSLNNSYVSDFSSNLLNVSYIQSIAFKSSAVTGTLFYNKELSGYKLIGNLLTSDIAYQYQLFKKLQLSSGITYLNNVDIARQLGIRQSLQLLAGKNYDVNAAVDLRKNLITPRNAALYASTRGELLFRYYLKTN
ncbi:hypothetical protein ACFGVS_01015 [Mucilaginibacter sp. AW1-7]|uniref:hypothetical protein n=1 Tax=Mucilaginibacter sp. AW1-7 TaxID=3349874 RepID=UPI003F735A90